MLWADPTTQSHQLNLSILNYRTTTSTTSTDKSAVVHKGVPSPLT